MSSAPDLPRHYPRRMPPEHLATTEAWLASAEPSTRALAAEFPIGTLLRDATDPDAFTWYVIGYVDGMDVIRVANGWPNDDAILPTSCGPMCAEHLRDGTVTVERLT